MKVTRSRATSCVCLFVVGALLVGCSCPVLGTEYWLSSEKSSCYTASQPFTVGADDSVIVSWSGNDKGTNYFTNNKPRFTGTGKLVYVGTTSTHQYMWNERWGGTDVDNYTLWGVSDFTGTVRVGRMTDSSYTSVNMWVGVYNPNDKGTKNIGQFSNIEVAGVAGKASSMLLAGNYGPHDMHYHITLDANGFYYAGSNSTAYGAYGTLAFETFTRWTTGRGTVTVKDNNGNTCTVFDNSSFQKDGSGNYYMGTLAMMNATGTITVNSASMITVGTEQGWGTDKEAYNYSGNSAMISGSLEGSGNLQINYTDANNAGRYNGRLILTGDNSGFSGAMTINSGTVQVGHTGAINKNLTYGSWEATEGHTYNGTTGTLGTGAVTVNSGASLVFSRADEWDAACSISGAGAMIQNGAGTTVLTGSNTGHSGSVTINAGTLQIGKGGTAGTLGSGNVSVASGAALAFNRSDELTVANQISGAGTIQQNGSGKTTLTGSISVGAVSVTKGTLQVNSGNYNPIDSASIAVSKGATFAFNFTGVAGPFTNSITGEGGFTKLGSGSLALNNASYTGATTVSEGTLVVTTGFTLPAASELVMNGGTLSMECDQEFAGLSGTSGTVSASALLKYLTINTAEGKTYTYSGTLTQNDAEKSLVLTKKGAGTQILAGTSDYLGDTMIEAGTLKLGANNALSTSRLRAFGGEFDLNGHSQTVNGLGRSPGETACSGTITDTNTADNTYGTLTINQTDQTYSKEHTGLISGKLKIVKSGAGEQILSGESNSYTGGTEINGGVLAVTHGSALGTGGVALKNGTLKLDTNSMTISNDITITGDNTSFRAGGTDTSLTYTISGKISGDRLQVANECGRAITLANSGNDFNGLRLGNGVNSMTGDVSFAKITMGADNSLGKGLVTFETQNGDNAVYATLDMNGHSNTGLAITGLSGGNAHSLLTNSSGTASTLKIDVAADTSYNYGGTITGSVALIKSGSGEQILSGENNSYTGGTEINGGVLAVTNGSALGTGGVTLENSTLKLDANSMTISNDITITGDNTSFRVGGTDTSLTYTISGKISGDRLQVANECGRAITLANNGNDFNGLRLGNGANGITGSDSHAVIVMEADNSLGCGLVTFETKNGDYDIYATLNMNGHSNTGRAIAGLSGGGAYSLLSNSSETASTLQIEVAADKSYNYGGEIAGSVNLIKSGSGTQILSGANSYGGTTISAGTLQIGNGGTTGTLGTGNVTLGAGAKLVFNRSDNLEAANGISDSGSLEKQGAGTLTLTGTVSVENVSVTGGKLILAGTSTISGTVSANGGTLAFTGAATLTNGINVAADSTLQLGNGTTGGSINAAVTFAASSSALEFNYIGISTKTFANTLSGDGKIIQNSTNTVQLSGNMDSFNGSVEILKGTLKFGSNSSVGGGTSITGGTLNLDSDVTVTSGVSMSSGKLKISAGALAGAVTMTGGTMTMSGGTLTGDVSVGTAETPGGTLTLSGGTLTGNVTVNGGTLTMTGGTLGNSGEKGSIFLYGGTVSLGNCTVEGDFVSYNGVSPVLKSGAKINGTLYKGVVSSASVSPSSTGEALYFNSGTTLQTTLTLDSSSLLNNMELMPSSVELHSANSLKNLTSGDVVEEDASDVVVLEKLALNDDMTLELNIQGELQDLGWIDLIQTTNGIDGSASAFNTLNLHYGTEDISLTGSELGNVLRINGNSLQLNTSGLNANVPEPGTWALMVLGLGSLLVMRRRRAK